MNKQCTVCGNLCSNTDQNCPVCGSPNLIAINEQPVQDTMQQPYMSGQIPYPNQPVYYNMPYSDSQTLAPEPPKKQGHKVLFIVFGSIGGVLVAGIILVVVLLNRFNQTPSSPFIASGSRSSHERTEQNNNSYYFPDYEQADHSSESYVQHTPADTEEDQAPDNTEDDYNQDNTTEATTANPLTEEGIAAFINDDLTFISNTSGQLIEMNPDFSYQIINSDVCRVYSLTGDNYTELSSVDGYSDFRTGRGTPIGAAIEEYITTYGIDTTNALWIMLNGVYTDAYYYSTVSNPSFSDDYTLLTIGWSFDGDHTHRLTPEELNDIIFNYDTTGNNMNYLIYYAEVNADFTIQSIRMLYGNPVVIPDYEEE